MNTNSIVSARVLEYRAPGFTGARGFKSICGNQDRIPGFEQDKLSRAHVALIGAGGIGGAVAQAAARKGYGHISIYDGDVVAPSNLCRQPFYFHQLEQNKSICLAENLLPQCSYTTRISAYPMMFEDAVHAGKTPFADVVECGPDNDKVRVFTSRLFLKTAPVVFIGIGEKAEHGYVFIQKPGNACFGCVFPSAVGETRMPCPGSPAVLDILMVTAGVAMTALDSLLMPNRSVTWNYWDIYPNGMIPTTPNLVKKNPDCPICGHLDTESTPS